MLALCIVAPGAVFGYLSLRKMEDRFRQETMWRMRLQGRAVVVSVHNGFDTVETEVKLAAGFLEEGAARSLRRPPEWNRLLRNGHLLGVTRFRKGSPPEVLFGNPCPPLSQTDASRRHLAAGKSVVYLRQDPGGSSRIFLARAIGGNGPREDTLSCEVNADYLWNRVRETVPPVSEVAVLPPGEGAPLFRTGALPVPVALLKRIERERRHGPAGTFEWGTGAEATLIGHAAVFLRPVFLSDDWTVVISQPESEAFAVAKHFTRVLLLSIALIMLVAGLFAHMQIRRNVAPLAVLANGTRRIRGGDFDSRVEIGSGDEFEELALSFNTMAEHLGKQFRDLTETNQRLEREIAERKQAEEQVRQLQKVETVGKLTGGIAHDFNNILTVINGYSQILLQELGADDPVRKRVEGIYDAGERASHLVNRLLTFSRKQIVEPKVVNLNKILSGMDMMLPRLIGADVVLTVNPAEDLWNVRIDPGQIEQVVVNLVVNARDAMPSGGEITIDTANRVVDGVSAAAGPHHIEEPGEYVMLRVSDTGSGIDESVRSRIFEPFFTTKPPGKGTGLGLSTVHGIVKESRGRIFVDSEVGRGTVFTVCFPREEAPSEELRISGKRPAEDWAGSETILLAEDGDLVRDLVRSILAAKGYKVVEARDGRESLETGSTYAGEIHLLVTDVAMPHMPGFELARRLAKIRPGMKTLYMSGYMEDTGNGREELPPGAAFLRKPFRPEALARKVREVLDG